MRASEPVASTMFLNSTICLPASEVTSILPGPARRPKPLITSTLFFFIRKLDALGVLGDDLVLALEDQREIQPRIFAVDTVFDGVLEMLPNVRRMQEGFGGNAADVEAATAQFRVFFNKGGLQTVLPRTNGR